jgi:ATP/maltotriose-dependent transcriptional regulator MalT/DNA-binding SARP family transcriptional activator
MSLEDRIRLPTLNLIHRRPRLLHDLETFIDSGYRFITIYAPGGYGKSILLADFTQTTNLPVCWCSLETSDRDPTTFLTLLVYSITDRFHEIDAKRLFALVERGDTQNSVRQIAALMAEIGPHIIIIDDYHKAVSAGMTLALNLLLNQLPETSTIIVAARGDMGLETGQIIDLLIADRATGLSEEELRFTPDEVKLIMRKRFGRQIDPATAAEIAQATDGNIAQILLTGHMMKVDQPIGSLKQQLGDDHEIIYQYLAAEVFGKQSPELQNFMLCTAVLPDMTVELCNDLLGVTNAQTCIETLVVNDLFVTQIGGGYRYHDLFAEFLLTKLRTESDRFYQITTKAAGLLTARDRVADAVPLYLTVHAWDETARLLQIHGKDFYNTGRALTLNNWLEQLPARVLPQYPQLLLLQGQIVGSDLGRIDESLDFFKKAETQFNEACDLIGKAETQIYIAAILRMTGQPREALLLATESLNRLVKLGAEKRLVAFATRSRGLAQWATGNITAALQDLRTSLELFEQLHDEFTAAMCHQEIGVCLVAQGNINGADHHYVQALRTWESLGNANNLANTLNSFGVSLYSTGRYEEALQQLKNSLDIAIQIRSMRRAAFAQAGIADVHLELAEYESAYRGYEQSTEFARAASVKSLEIYNLVKTGEGRFRQGDMALARQLAIQARDISAEAGLDFEKGLALSLQGKIYVKQREWRASFALFSEAVDCFSDRDVLELARARLWWGYGLWQDFRPLAAGDQIQEVVRMTLEMGELMHGLSFAVFETQELLKYFLHHPDTHDGLRTNIWLLLTRGYNKYNLVAPALQVFAFGLPTLIVAGQRKQFSHRGGVSQSPEFLLFMLLEGMHNGCSWSEISLAIWPDLSREKASIKFHQTLRSLRRTILPEQDYIVVKEDLYQLNPDYLNWCDAVAFDQLFNRLAYVDPTEALELQLELLSLCDGEFLSGFELGEWGESRRLSYETRYLQVVKLASDQLLTRNAPQEALRIIDAGLTRDYFREDLHQNALRAYAQAYLFDSMASHYDALCLQFKEELNVLPSLPTQELYDELKTSR